jgi:hypothetical protein
MGGKVWSGRVAEALLGLGLGLGLGLAPHATNYLWQAAAAALT